jgi:predicted MPP superfamily phosphohydrolase
MFHTIITLFYIVPNIYAFLRIRKHFINKRFYLPYTLIYLLIALIYPIDQLFSENNMGFQTGTFAILARYILPFYLYLFLSVLVVDILLFLNRKVKVIRPEKLNNTLFKATALSCIVLFSLGVVIAGMINFFNIRTTEYHVEIPRRSSEISHLKIAFVADFHLRRSTDPHFVERFVKEIKKIQPDLMLFGGDIVEASGLEPFYVRYEKMLKEIHPRYGVFAVLGNHERDGIQEKGRFFDLAGMQVLCDSVVTIDHAFNLAGRYDNHFQNRKSIGDLLKSATDSLPVILMDHRPTDILEASKNRIDVQFSGHTHNGQLFPLNFIIDMIYPLGYGYKKIANTHFFVTSGIMLWGPTVRTTAKSEIIVLDVEMK